MRRTNRQLFPLFTLHASLFPVNTTLSKLLCSEKGWGCQCCEMLKASRYTLMPHEGMMVSALFL